MKLYKFVQNYLKVKHYLGTVFPTQVLNYANNALFKQYDANSVETKSKKWKAYSKKSFGKMNLQKITYYVD